MPGVKKKSGAPAPLVPPRADARKQDLRADARKQDLRADARKQDLRADARKQDISADARKQDILETPRNYAPRGIAALIAPIARPAFRRRAPAAAQLLADWPQLAGPELAARAAPVKFAGGTLTLGCTGPTAMELQFAEPQIIARLNLALGQNMVERLRFVQQSPRLPAAPLPRPAPRNVPLPPGLPPGELGEALARLYRGLKTRG